MKRLIVAVAGTNVPVNASVPLMGECPELLESIPVLMRDPKDLDV